MTDIEVPQGTSVQLERVEGTLKVANHATIRAASGRLVVTEGAEFYGSALVEGNLECASLRVERSGRLRVTGDLTVESTLDVSNSIEVSGTMKADSVDVGGHIRARSLSCQRMRVGGTAEISESLNADSVGVGGKLEARGTVDIGDLQVGGKSEIGDRGPGLSTHFWGQTVRIQARTSQVEDVYASTLRIGPGSRARRIFAETVELGSECDVEEVTYVKELKMGDHVRIARPVRKVDKIPEPPV